MHFNAVDEEWKPVVGYERAYEVSDLGRVRALRGNGPVLLNLYKSGHGYLSVTICGRTRTVHTVVVQAFFGLPAPGMEVNHKDGNKLNSVLSNLEYVTRTENVRHAVATGLKKGWAKPKPQKMRMADYLDKLKQEGVIGGRVQRGSGNFQAKLTEHQVREIKSYLWHGCRICNVAAFMKVSQATISFIRDGKRWGHVSI